MFHGYGYGYCYDYGYGYGYGYAYGCGYGYGYSYGYGTHACMYMLWDKLHISLSFSTRFNAYSIYLPPCFTSFLI